MGPENLRNTQRAYASYVTPVTTLNNKRSKQSKSESRQLGKSTRTVARMPRRFFALATASVVALATLAFVSPAQSANNSSAGNPDWSFGNGGKLTIGFDNHGVNDDYARAIAVYPDGRFIVAGTAHIYTDEFAVMRFKADGTRDNSFGTNGVVIANNGFFHDRAYAAAIQPDGKIVVSGYAFGDDFFTIRLNPNGSLDPSFGWGGKVTTDFAGFNDQAHGVHLQGDKIVVTGWAATGEDNAAKQFAAVRYLSNGSVDTSYGTNGKVMIPMATDADGNGSLIQPDGKVIIAGRTLNSPGVYGVGLARLNTNGSLDNSFGTGGKVLTSFGPVDETLNAITLQPNGKIVAVGNAQFGSYFDTMAMRLNANGSPDTSFGTGGMLRANFSLDNDSGNSVLIRPDGKIVIAGSYYEGNGDDMYVARLWPNGARDIQFGSSGVSRVQMSLKYDQAWAVAIQGTKLIAVGRSFNGKDNDWSLIRLFDGPGLVGNKRYPVSFSRPGAKIKASRLRSLAGSSNTPSLSRVDVSFLKVNKKLLKKRKKCDWMNAKGRAVRLSASKVNGKWVCSDAYWNTVVGTDSWNIRLGTFKPGVYRIQGRAMSDYGQLGFASTRNLRITKG
jgi:uncharacterized delta-60 repeat protein